MNIEGLFAAVTSVLRKQASQHFTVGEKDIYVTKIEASMFPRILDVPSDSIYYILSYAPDATLDDVNAFLRMAPSHIQISRIFYGLDEETILLQFLMEPGK
jgi:hypothetical protein